MGISNSCFATRITTREIYFKFQIPVFLDNILVQCKLGKLPLFRSSEREDFDNFKVTETILIISILRRYKTVLERREDFDNFKVTETILIISILRR